MNERIRLFSNGGQYLFWQEGNCFKCPKYRYNPQFTCPLDKEIGKATFGDGKVSAETASRIGYKPQDWFWHCPEKPVVKVIKKPAFGNPDHIRAAKEGL